MKLEIDRRQARPAACAAIVARCFYGLSVEGGQLHNGAWLCAIAGALLAAPLIQCMRALRGHSGKRVFARLLAAALIVVNVFDCAEILAVAARSAGFLALERSPAWVLTLPVAIAALLAILRGGDAIGSAAAVSLRAAALLVAVVALMQLHALRPRWLFPLLGSGAPALLEGSFKAAGWTGSICGLFLLESDEANPTVPHSVRNYAFLAVAVNLCSVLIALRLMMSPTIRPGADNTWLIRLDTLLTNGRAGLYVQLPMIVMWYAGLLHLVACEGFIASSLLQRLAPGLDGRLCALSSVAAITALSIARPAFLAAANASHAWIYAVIAVLGALALVEGAAKGGASPCAF